MFTALLKTAEAAALLIAGIIIGAALSSFAQPQYEIAVGHSQGKAAPDGIWWEHQFATDNRVSSPTWQIGASSKFKDSQWGVRWDFGQLLKFSTRNMAVWDEKTADQVARGELTCVHATGSNCLAKFNGDGQAFGLHIGIYREFEIGRFKVQPEAGLLPYYYDWSMTVEHPNDSTPTQHVTEATGAGIFLTEYARLTVKRGMFFVRADYNHFIKGHNPVAGIQEGKVLSYLIGAAVSF